ncbi:hypothetical protein [Streptomyces sp. 21So2-11]|uniref:hypothetical protein n=1 Tax=Streptomyces sp. 21So2-11 TaxID=3144408 RepID=UPI00321A4027
MRTYILRPGYIQPLNGAKPSARAQRAMNVVSTPLYPLLRWILPRHVTTTDAIGRAMLAVTRLEGAGPHVLDSSGINRAAATVQ